MSFYYNITKRAPFSKLKNIDFYNIFLDLVSILLIIAVILLIVNPARYIASVNSGIRLFFVSVFPSLLPFLFISKLLDGLNVFHKLNKLVSPINNKLFGVPSISSYPIIMSLLSGYPIGAKIVGEMVKENQISYSEAKQIIALSSTSGPIFVIGSVGANMLGSVKIGALILLSHFLGAFITGLLYTLKRPKKYKPVATDTRKLDPNLLKTTTNSTIISILTVAVYISIFYMFIDMLFFTNVLNIASKGIAWVLNLIKISPAYASGISSGLIEMTRGCKEIIAVGNPLLSLVFCSGLISFGGLSIIIQSLTFLSGTKISGGYFIGLKFVQMAITIMISIIVGLIFI